MTKEEALKIWLPVIKMGVESIPECSEALDMAIKALEQGSVLDKIKAEIEEITKCPYGTECLGANCPFNTDCMICGDHVLEIIDKYKAESEENE